MPSLNISSYIAMALTALLVIGGVYANMQISSLKIQLLTSQSDAKDYKHSLEALVVSFETQSRSIEKNKADKEKALSKLKHFMSLPVKERVIENIITIYKDVNTTREGRNCEDRKKIESNTYNLDWNK